MNSGSSLFSLSSWSSSSSSSTFCGNAAFKFHSLGLLTFFILFFTQNVAGEHYGKFIGNLSELHHGVSGQVYAVDSRTLFIKDFTYDGEGPAGYFYAGNSRAPIINGFKLRDEKGSAGPLKAYNKKSISIALPEGKSLNNIRWFSVYCDDYSVNFGDVRIPRGFDFPKPQKLAALNGIHRVKSDPIVVIDAQTLLVPSFSYDGEAPDVKFWVGTGSAPSPQGIRVPDENGKTAPLPSYNNKTIVLTLPGDLTIFQIDYFSVYCEAFAVSFAFIHIPKGLNVPPSLNMLGISPQSKLNCEVLEDSLAFEVRWAIAGDSIVVQLVAKLDANQYMSFGLSANPDRSIMVGGDVVVAWVDKQTLQGFAVDYILDAKSQCSGTRGSCPDTRIQDNTNSIRLLNAALVNDYSIITYQRPLLPSDELDLPINTTIPQAIIWAIGPLNERNEVSFHSHYPKTTKLIEFGRVPTWNCPMPENSDFSAEESQSKEKLSTERATTSTTTTTTKRPTTRAPATPAPASTANAWVIPPIECNEPEDGVLYAQMGPTGGKHGYPAITGHVGWGIAWYINGLLIPEINVVRGRNYTFVVEAGDEVDTPSRYHPFYITDDPVGGYEHKTAEEKAKVKIFAGVKRQKGSNSLVSTGSGRFCYWYHDPNQPEADSFESFGGYQRTLTLKCDPGDPAIVQWTPDEHTPDTVYYQCFAHRYLGWKINVLDSCNLPDKQQAASEQHQVYVKLEKPIEDLSTEASIGASNKVTPTNYYHVQVNHQQPEYQYHQQMQLNPRYHNHHDYTPSNQLASQSSLQLTNAYSRNTLKTPNPGAFMVQQHQQHYQQLQQYPSQVQPNPQQQAFTYLHHYQYPQRHQMLMHRHPERVTYHRENIPTIPTGRWRHQSIHDSHDQEEQMSQSYPMYSSNPYKLIPDARPIYGSMKYSFPQSRVNHQYLYAMKKSGALPISKPMPQLLSQHPKIMSPKSDYLTDTSVTPKYSGFNPDSIVIEGGFKPIIRDVNNYPNYYHQFNNSTNDNSLSYPVREKYPEKISSIYKTNDDMEMIENSLDFRFLSDQYLQALSNTPLKSSSFYDSNNQVNNNNNNNNNRNSYLNYRKSSSKKFKQQTPVMVQRTRRSMEDEKMPVSMGQMLIMNINYVILTVILYFAI